MGEQELYLTDLIDTETLQQIQDAFSELMGMAALTTDSAGVPVTKASGFTDFCMKYTRASEEGHKRCESCDRMGAEITHRSGTSVSYRCHAGLVDFAAPIIANKKIVGSFIGGQILIEPPYIPSIRDTAVDLGIDPDEYEAAVKEVRIISKEKVEKAAHFLYAISSVLSKIAFKSYELHKSNLQIEKASNMKSDFLANMSHEIRTPMNAVIGLADLALREEMPRAAREYVHQIKASGKNLLVIINDILDFSKIESGKMDIIEAEYEPLSVVQDLSSIVNSRIGDKDVEFTMDISPDMPKVLYGDNVRIHQIILNLLTNAVKFTQCGEVHFKMSFEPIDDETINMKVEISDTGLGIKKEDMHKLFNSFQQVDSKRNRNIEGTGLGLAISQQLLKLMGGDISLESEYEKGTTFFFNLPQKIIDPTPMVPKLEKRLKVAVFVENRFTKAQLSRDLERINTEHIDLTESSFNGNLNVDYMIVEQSLVTQKILDYVKDRPNLQCLELMPFDSMDAFNIPNIHMISKPVYSLSLYNALGLQGINLNLDAPENDKFSFIAPDAHILIVDDNPVNLTVAMGLLEPLRMRVDTSQSAADAIEKIHYMKYDLIFMDHMMPEVDGIEATHIIRRLVPSYKSVPIIALTANAIGNAKKMFLSEGMNDFVAKPIDVNDILAKLKKWLPDEKILPYTEEEAMKEDNQNHSHRTAYDVKELNVKNALSLLGTEKLFWAVLEEYFGAIEKKAKTILGHKAAERWRDYTIEVHSLKSTSRQIGADHISDMAAEMEKAGNEENIELINEKTDSLIKEYLQLHDALSKYFSVDEEEECIAGFDDIIAQLDMMREALDNFDTLQIDEVIEVMSKFQYSDNNAAYFERLKEAAVGSDIDSCLAIVKEWNGALINSDSEYENMLRMLDSLRQAIESFDILNIYAVVESMSHYSFVGKYQEFFDRLNEAAENGDINHSAEIAAEWRNAIENEN